MTPRQVRRLRVGLRQEGPAGPHRLPEGHRTQIVTLARGRHAGLNELHLTEKLTTVEGLTVSRTTVRRALRAVGAVSPRRRRPPRHRSRRPRRPQAGLLCQLDGSSYAWFGPTQPVCSLLGAIGDATGAVRAATFRPRTTPPATSPSSSAIRLFRTTLMAPGCAFWGRTRFAALRFLWFRS